MKLPTMIRKHNRRTIIVCLFLSLILSGMVFSKFVQAKTKKICFKKEITTLTVGKKFHFQIKHLPKKAEITYSCNHRTIAKIHKKKGILTAKKQGKVTIRAKIVTAKKKKTTLKTTVHILGQKKSSPTTAPSKAKQEIPAQKTGLPNTSLKVSSQINPWNHSFVLYSSRILLNEEVKNSCLTLHKVYDNASAEKNNVHTITAKFHSLSDDGKQAIYKIDNTDAAKLCPGNGTSNGTYQITGNILSNSLSIQYKERLSPNEIRGFAFDAKENVLPNVEVSLFTETDDSDSPLLYTTVRTNQNGYYVITNVPDNHYHLVFSKEGYLTANSKSFCLKESIHCENITLKSWYNNITCQIRDSSHSLLSDIPVTIRKKNSSLQWCGFTDKQGLISLSNTSQSDNTNYTKIQYRSTIQTPKSIQGAIPLPEAESQIISDSFSPEDEYIVTICSDSSAPLQYAPLSFTVSPKDSRNEQILFDITLKPISILQTSNLSIKLDIPDTDATSDNYIANVDSLKMQILEDDGCSIFSDVISINTVSSSQQDITHAINAAFQDAELYLQDGNYYIILQAIDTAGHLTYTPFVSAVTVKNGFLPPIYAAFSHGISVKIVLTGNFSSRHDALPCTLYEFVQSQWIPIFTLQSTSFEVLTNTCSKAYVTCYPLLQNHTYRLESADAEVCFTGNNIFTSKEDTVRIPSPGATIPSLQITCCLQNKPAQSTEAETAEHFHSHTEISCDTQFFQTVDYVKNCVYAYYQKDGTLCSVFLMSETDRLLLNDKNNTIAFYDILQSGKTIKTSHDAYRLSSFYV